MFKIYEWSGAESIEHADLRDVRGFTFGITLAVAPMESPYRYAFHAKTRTEAEALAGILNRELSTGDARKVLARAVGIAQGRALADKADRAAGEARLAEMRAPVVAEAVEP